MSSASNAGVVVKIIGEVITGITGIPFILAQERSRSPGHQGVSVQAVGEGISGPRRVFLNARFSG